MSLNKTIAAFLIILHLVANSASAQSERNTPVVRIVKEWGPSVVNISTEQLVPLRQHAFWSQYGDALMKQVQSRVIGTMKLNGIGSGVIVREDGLIVTNAHVVNMASKIYVILSDGTMVQAALVAINPSNDLALIKIDLSRAIKPIKLAKDVMIGETVVSIGNPLGLENSVSAGVVSGLNRTLSAPNAQIAFTGLIQTDASINQGSSGGAILNLDGELVGINLAVVQGAQSIGFAIPASKITMITNDYKEAMQKQTAGH